MLKEFKTFVMRGNLLDLAVALILALTFAAVVNAFIAGIVLPIIAAVFGQPNFDALTLTIGDGVIAYGTFLTQLLNFVLVAFVLFLIVKAYNRSKKAEEASTRECPYCFSAIPVKATRCSACTSEVPAAA